MSSQQCHETEQDNPPPALLSSVKPSLSMITSHLPNPIANLDELKASASSSASDRGAASIPLAKLKALKSMKDGSSKSPRSLDARHGSGPVSTSGAYAGPVAHRIIHTMLEKLRLKVSFGIIHGIAISG